MASLNQQRLIFEWRRIRRQSLPTLLGKALAKLLGFCLGFLLLPATALLHIAGYRYVTIFTDRVGHLALEPDCLLKEQILGRIRRRKWIMLAPSGRVANEHLLAYWSPHFHIVKNGLGCFLIVSMSRWGLMRHDVSHYARVVGRTQESFLIHALWAGRPPLLTLSADDLVYKRNALEELGLPVDAWFVCVHAREGGFSPTDEELHSHRNGSIKNLIPAMQKIVQSGGWVIRIGDASMEPLPAMTNIIDYARHPLKSPRLDVILCASCKFILGSTSGICLVGSVFGVPCAISNMVPTADLWYGHRDISIPKAIWSERHGRFLTLMELLQFPQGCYRYAKQYADEGLRLTENSSEDIEDLACEMMDRLGAEDFTSPEDALTLRMYREASDDRYTSRHSCAHLGATYYRKYGLPDTKRLGTQGRHDN